MKITTQVSALANALDFIASVTPKRSPIPIVEHTLLAVDNGILTITCTDLDIALIAQI